MTEITFYSKNGLLSGFRTEGHSGYAESGEDIVCASVSSLVRFTVNLLTEDFKYHSTVKVSEKTAEIEFLLEETDETSDRILKALRREAEMVRDEYPLHINIINTEV